MPYISNTPGDVREMLAAIGAGSIDELFAMIPAELRMNRALDIPPAMGEMELTDYVYRLAAKNHAACCAACFLGAGSYDHFIPSVVDFVASRSEFYTAYTPYQPEASQGSLTAMFEYQTLITQLTGMDVSNASLYDGGTAAVEAVLMAVHARPKANRVVVAGSVHPEYRQVLATYLANVEAEIVTVPTPSGAIQLADLAAAVNDRTACVLIQHPNFFGCMEDAESAARLAHAKNALFIPIVDPISLGLLKRPGDYGADIVVAEGQSLGIPMSFGGPGVGIMACRDEFVRRLPGRIVGETVDRRGNRCFVLTLQTREQHIRREKATSNICTNQGLMALRAAVYLSTVGPQGLRQMAELCLQKSRYAAAQIVAKTRLTLPFAQPTFKEFTVRAAGKNVEQLLAAAERQNVLAGVPLGRWYPELADCFLVTVTEKRTKEEIDRLVEVLG